MSMTFSIYSWAAARLDEKDLVEVMRRHGYSVRRIGKGRSVPAAPLTGEAKRLFDTEVAAACAPTLADLDPDPDEACLLGLDIYTGSLND